MGIIIQSSWQALKDVAYMYITGIIMSVLTVLNTGNASLVFTHAGWGFLAVSLYLLATIEYSTTYHRDNNKDKANRKLGVILGILGLIASVLLLNVSVESSLKAEPIQFSYYPQALWFAVITGTLLRYLSRNISLQRASGRYA